VGKGVEIAVLSKCANPECKTPFKYLREGRLVRLSTGVSARQPRVAGEAPHASLHRSEFFWLCGACSPSFTLLYDEKAGIHLIPIASPRRDAMPQEFEGKRRVAEAKGELIRK
jgi:hypothetical protein